MLQDAKCSDSVISCGNNNLDSTIWAINNELTDGISTLEKLAKELKLILLLK